MSATSHRPLRLGVLTGLFAVAVVGSPALAQWNRAEYTAPRSADAPARGARLVRITAKAGSLDIQGRKGLTEVRARGTARASERAWLEEIQLITRRVGDVVEVEVQIPDWDSRDRHRNGSRLLDLVVEVPDDLALDVTDGSGRIDIRDVGALTLSDGSGEILLQRIRGSVRLEDGSGEMTIRDVTGSVIIERDGSGGIDIEQVTGSVDVRADGSGGIRVRQVGGDFTVGSDGSGGISYSEIRGVVRVPEKRSRKHRRPAG